MKILTAALAALLIMCVGAQAQRRSSPSPSYFYLFGEYDYYSGSGASSNGGGLGLGWNFNRFLGVQAGGQYLTKTGVNLANLYGEFKLSWPVTNRFSLYGSIGGAYANASGNVTLLTAPPIAVHVSSSSTGYRAGLGAEYWFTDRWGLRAGFHRQNAGGVADDISAGISFRF